MFSFYYFYFILQILFEGKTTNPHRQLISALGAKPNLGGACSVGCALALDGTAVERQPQHVGEEGVVNCSEEVERKVAGKRIERKREKYVETPL